MFAEGGAAVDEVEGSPEVVTESFLSPSEGLTSAESVFDLDEELLPLLAVTSSEEAAAPVFARLWCFCCSLSEGERDLLRFESSSGIANFSLQKGSIETDWGCEAR